VARTVALFSDLDPWRSVPPLIGQPLATQGPRRLAYVSASPDRVYAVPSDGWAYSDWVTGTSHVRAVEMDGPLRAVGTSMRRACGPPWCETRPRSSRRYLRSSWTSIARGWPLGEARVTLRLAAESSGTRVELEESPSPGPGRCSTIRACRLSWRG